MRIEYERDESGPSVPRDRFLEPRWMFHMPSQEAAGWAFHAVHEISEALYEGDGVWQGNAPEYLVRFTSRRVLGYISAYRMLSKEIFRQRALEGLEHLLREQKPSGTFVWYNRSSRGIDNRNDGLYETGIAGRAFVEGFRLTGDERFIAASERAGRWAMDCPISENNNYNMFSVWHLAAHYGETGDGEFLEAAIQKTRDGGFPGQFDSGGWPGHNSWTWYHGIIIRGMAELLNVLPSDHAFRAELLPRLTAAINRIITEQEESGAVPANPGVVDDHHRMTFALQGLLIARDSFGSVLDNYIHGMARYRIRTEPNESEVEEFKRSWNAHKAAKVEAQARAVNELVWHYDFERFHSDDDWGEMAEGWFNACYPMNDPVPGQVLWARDMDPVTGICRQEYRTMGAAAFGGIGFRIPSEVLVPGQSYRFDIRVQCRESEGARESIELVFASVYCGGSRPGWDCASECTIRNEEPVFEGRDTLSVRFTAGGDTCYVYVWMRADPVPEGETASFLVDGAELYREGEPAPGWRSDLKYDDWDCDLMVSGLYLERMFRRAQLP